MKRVKVKGLCLVGLGLMSVFAFALAGGASAAPLLFIPESGKYPYHLVGTGGKSELLTIGGKEVKSEKVDTLASVLNATLADVHIEFLKATSTLGSKCSNTSNSETILVNLLEHLGFADPGTHPAGLFLVPSGFEFTCSLGPIKEVVKVKGEVIGTITSPALNVSSEELTVVFKQEKGKQEFTEFLLGSTLLTNQIEETSVGGNAFEQSGQSSEATTIKALPGQGKFSLVSP